LPEFRPHSQEEQVKRTLQALLPGQKLRRPDMISYSDFTKKHELNRMTRNVGKGIGDDDEYDEDDEEEDEDVTDDEAEELEHRIDEEIISMPFTKAYEYLLSVIIPRIKRGDANEEEDEDVDKKLEIAENMLQSMRDEYMSQTNKQISGEYDKVTKRDKPLTKEAYINDPEPEDKIVLHDDLWWFVPVQGQILYNDNRGKFVYSGLKRRFPKTVF
jgi:hypothetical protein